MLIQSNQYSIFVIVCQLLLISIIVVWEQICCYIPFFQYKSHNRAFRFVSHCTAKGKLDIISPTIQKSVWVTCPTSLRINDHARLAFMIYALNHSWCSFINRKMHIIFERDKQYHMIKGKITQLRKKTSRTWIFVMRKICTHWIFVLILYQGQTEVKVTWHVWAHPVVILTKISHDWSMYVAAVAIFYCRVNNVNRTHPHTHTHPHTGAHFIVPSQTRSTGTKSE